MHEHHLRELLDPDEDPRVRAALETIAAGLVVEVDEVTVRRHRRHLRRAIAASPVGLARRLTVATGAAAGLAVVLGVATTEPTPVVLGDQRAVEEQAQPSVAVEDLHLFQSPVAPVTEVPPTVVPPATPSEQRADPAPPAPRELRPSDAPRDAATPQATPPADPAPPRGRVEERPPAGPPATPPHATPAPPGNEVLPRATPSPGRPDHASQGERRSTSRSNQRGRSDEARSTPPPGHAQRSSRADTARPGEPSPPRGPQQR